MVSLCKTYNVREDNFRKDSFLLNDTFLHGLFSDGLFRKTLDGIQTFHETFISYKKYFSKLTLTKLF